MALEKITTSEVQTLHVQAAPDNLIGTANQNKGVFDALPEKIVEKYNDTITKLTSNEEGSSGASQIVISAIQGLVGTTVQAALESLKAAQSGQATDISSCITSWTLDPTTGNITVTKFDGTSTVYETELEKVVTNFTYDSNTQSLILTYPDGTTTSVSLASFIDEYDFEDSASIAFTVSGHKVTATLTSEYYNTLLGFKTAAEAAATNAGTYAGNASVSATAAAGSATAALNSEIAAKTSKELADASASAASGSATAAATSAAQAAASATTAGTYADEAGASEESAASSAQAAATSATAASTSATNASTSASEASTSAGSAASSATAAQTSANNAASSANAASGSATNANSSAAAAAGSASAASGSAQTSSEEALVSEGYANGTQNGEPVDSSSPYFHNNSKYWKEQAAAAASGQSKITATGMLKGLGNGNVTSAIPGTDYQTPLVAGTDYMAATDPTGTGSFSLNRRADTTVGFCSFAEGFDAVASGDYSHAEGIGTTASGGYSHAEGFGTVADGVASHVEGTETVALHPFSHAEGFGTFASGVYQHVQGIFNVKDQPDDNAVYADIIGNGTADDARKNIEATTWTGDKRLKGNVYVECEDDSTGGIRLAKNTEIPTNISQLYEDSNHQTVAEADIACWNGKANSADIGRQSVVSQDSSYITYSLQANTVLICNTATAVNSLSVTLEGLLEDNKTVEWTIIFKGDTSPSIEFIPPNGTEIIWKGGEPMFTNALYEISFLFTGYYIIGIASEIEI